MMRQQSLMTRAITHVREVAASHDEDTRDIYGGMCHKFPVLVRTCGLCQALAFIESKASNGNNKQRERAHDFLRRHVLLVLQGERLVGDQATSALEAVRTMPMRDYAFATRVLLHAWVFYKRFAESVLGVETSEQGEQT